MVAGPVEENLRLVFEPPKRARMNDARPIALKLSPEWVLRLRVFSAARIPRFLRKRRQHAPFIVLHLLARFPAVDWHVRIILSPAVVCESGLAVFCLALRHRPSIVSEPSP